MPASIARRRPSSGREPAGLAIFPARETPDQCVDLSGFVHSSDERPAGVGSRQDSRHNSTFEGVVIHGEKIGRTIGFPTANIALQGACPAQGIYAARVELQDGRTYLSVAYYGNRPTLDGRGKFLEVFLFNFCEDIYGDRLRVELVRHIRGDKKFNSIDEMAIQIESDCDRALQILGGVDEFDQA
ncbi:riboflavin kinase [Phenylobacterium montanum]|uniref:riboflavin kinase n=1 Tax=Phenylobacterium montanum TaxID=2823693 RepID=A0A975IYB2_9CAUL|nr:riboflavin kinase [Caulobacter sp. S6]QUD90271.1 riboflavin kinase [Caulobacter sp. S6]